ncbi:hypothetical protein CVT26_011353 [Gymnopilus dilepis]|uniref:FAD-binding PCMH-type domain-containing protein n=1 Tax=Gymnopilus dilepis TaxID=231916 RepID=A0A409W8T2_9AGAR|nr:hypothetical protein CVT26_011353 [Gymnopilus dilepis]
MQRKAFYCLQTLILSAFAAASTNAGGASQACNLLKQALPGSVFFPGSTTYAQDIAHFEFSSSQNATCSVEPASVKDVSTILQIVGRADIRSPFAIVAGGHATNRGFSSTTGVQVSLTKFRNTTYDAKSQTVTLQPGKTWDQIYEDLEPFNVTVAGGRVAGVGVGLALGGGYSWVTDQVGLSIDNILAFDLVLPNGTFVQVRNDNYPELFFGLKGGLNNFGIVTSLTFKAVQLGKIWAGVINYDASQADSVAQAVSNFSLQNTDEKAQMAAAYVNSGGSDIWQVIMFYAEPQQPSVFQPFLDIPNIGADVSVRSFSNFLQAINVVQTDAFSRGISHMLPVIKYTPKIVAAIQQEVDAAYAKAVADGKSITSSLLGIEPFYGAFNHSTSPSAYPHDPSRPVTPCNPWLTYSSPDDDDYFNKALWDLANKVQAVAVEEGQSRWDDIRYPNYVLGNTPLQLLYGDNLPKLRAIKRAVDPKNVMGLAGGFKF